MSDALAINVSEWVEQARQDPLRYFERQATEIVLNAIGLAPALGKTIFLKGGTLMAVVYQSPRQTADLDFSTSLSPKADVDKTIGEALTETLPQAAARLGYPGVTLRVQTVTRRPRKDQFAEAGFPALQIKVGYARRGTYQEVALQKGQCANVISLDISFNEPIINVEPVHLGADGVSICVYSLADLIAEKLRGLLQQPIRNRYRRQDIYDIALLLKKFEFSDDDRQTILNSFLEKSRSRDIEPTPDSLDDPEVIKRASAEWETLALEVSELPLFAESLDIVRTFYRVLPWPS
jgi:predicted nucleotidyltransferase component of viral defense system